MSHIVEIRAKMTDLEAIKAASKRLGFTFQEGQTTFKWWGHYEGDTQLAAQLQGLSDKELGTCEHAIRVPGCTYELGLTRTNNGSEWAIRWDYFQGTLKQAMGGEQGHRFIQAYAIEKARMEATRRGHRFAEQPQPDGSVKITITTH